MATEFLQALNGVLTSADFDRLTGVTVPVSPETVRPWARARHINCPCVVTAATALALDAQRSRDPSGAVPPEHRDRLRRFSPSYIGPSYPAPWRAELRRLNELPPDTERLDDVLHSGWEPGLTVDAALAKSRVLAPIAADPLRESLAGVLQRVRNHWLGRARRARTVMAQAGVRVRTVGTAPARTAHANWLARHQVRGESASQIAASLPGARDPRLLASKRRTVQAAITRAATLLGLKVRRVRPGRPRK